MHITLSPLPAKTLLVDILVPVYNEEGDLARSIRALNEFLKASFPFRYRITIVDNGSTDGTLSQARKLEKNNPSVSVAHLDEKGRGRALKTAWLHSDADLLAYMDVDLSTDLQALPALLAPLVSGEAAVCVGSRLLPESKVTRSAKREFISRTYNFLLGRSLNMPVKDAQCGFKALRRDAAEELLPLVTDTGWFFDTELLARARALNMPVREIPVSWTEDPDSRVNVVSTAIGDLQGIDRLRRDAGSSPLWEWPLLCLLLVGTAVLYLVGLSKEGYANTFYAAAVQAGTKSWSAFFFGSFDSANFITVDKPPLSLWVMELFGRVFGFSRLSMLVPDALAGVLSVFLLQRTVRRWYGAAAGLLAGLFLALTPVAVVMFRYNNPDAVLTALLVASGYFFVLALESGKTKWLVAVGAVLGLAFISKMLQALIILPIYAVLYVWLGKPELWTRIKQALWAGLALVLAGGWWPLIVGLIPKTDRPFVGGSTNDSEWNLIFGYNGLGRINGSEGRGRGGAGMAEALGGQGGGFGGGMFGGQTGPLRMFEAQFGGQISWLLPLALFLVVIGIVSRRGKARTDLPRAGFMLWGGWLLIHAAVFSFAQGIIHEYYSVVMAPALAALIGAGLPLLWSLRSRRFSWLWPVALAGSAVWAWVLLERSPNFLPWLHWTVAIGSAVAAVAWLALAERSSNGLRSGVFAVGILALLAGPVAYDLQTVQAAHSGGQPTAGPATASSRGQAGARFGGPGGQPTRGFAGELPAGFTRSNQAQGGQAAATAFAGFGGGEQSADPQLVSYLKSHMGTATWAAAVSTTSAAGPLELALDEPVMGMGGFMGSDPALTLAQFEAYVQQGKLRYVVVTAGGRGAGTTDGARAAAFAGFGAGGGNSAQNTIQSWVTAHGVKVDYGGSGSQLYEVGAS